MTYDRSTLFRNLIGCTGVFDLEELFCVVLAVLYHLLEQGEPFLSYFILMLFPLGRSHFRKLFLLHYCLQVFDLLSFLIQFSLLLGVLDVCLCFRVLGRLCFLLLSLFLLGLLLSCLNSFSIVLNLFLLNVFVLLPVFNLGKFGLLGLLLLPLLGSWLFIHEVVQVQKLIQIELFTHLAIL